MPLGELAQCAGHVVVLLLLLLVVVVIAVVAASCCGVGARTHWQKPQH
jgi:hypothetical protein